MTERGETAPARPQILNAGNNTRCDRREGNCRCVCAFYFCLLIEVVLTRCAGSQTNRLIKLLPAAETFGRDPGRGGYIFPVTSDSQTFSNICEHLKLMCPNPSLIHSHVLESICHLDTFLQQET